MTQQAKRKCGGWHRDFLDALRRSGSMNMFEAWRPLTEEFGLSKDAAIEVLADWMDTFEKEEES